MGKQHVEMRGSVTNYLKILCVASYPSDTIVGNVSKDTTVKQLMSIEGIDKELFKLQNINLFFGSVNSLEYCNVMHGMPTLIELKELAKEIS